MPDDDQQEISGSGAAAAPMGGVGAQEGVAAAVRQPRRRAARRPAGPPPADATGEGPTEPADAAAPAEPAAADESASDTPASDTPASDTPAGDTPASNTAPPEPAAKAAARPRRRTTKKTAAPPPAEDGAPEVPADMDVPAAPAQPAAPDDATDPAPAPAKKTAKRASRKRAAAAPDVAAEDGPADPPVDAPAAAEQPGASEPAAPRRRSRKAALAAATSPLPDGPAELETPPEAPAEAPAQPAVVLPPVVIFQPPVETPAPVRRRRRATSADVAPVADLADAADIADIDLTQAETALALSEGDAAGLDAEDVDAEDVDATDTPESEEQGDSDEGRRRRRRGGRGRRRSRGADDVESRDAAEVADGAPDADLVAHDAGDLQAADTAEAGEPSDGQADDEPGSRSRRRRRRRRGGAGGADDSAAAGDVDDAVETVVHVREPRRRERNRDKDSNRDSGRESAREADRDTVTGFKGSTRLEAKKQRRREGREQGRRRPPILSEAEFLARREAVERVMVVRQVQDRTQIAVLEDGVLVEHYVNRSSGTSMAGNVYLGKVQNVLPSMEAAFVDIGRGRNAVLYAGEVNWDAAGLEGQPKRIELALKSGDPVLVQVTKDPIGSKGARLTSQISLPGRFLVYVPDGSMTGISRKLPETERARLKSVLRQVVPESAGVIVRTASEGASEEELGRDVARLQAQWEDIEAKARTASAPALLYGEPDLSIRVVRDLFNEDFARLVIAGDEAWETIEPYLRHVAPDLGDRLSRWTSEQDVFVAHRVDEQLAKALDRKVYLPSGGSLVIDRTEAMVVVDVNTGKFIGKGSNLEETVTRNNLEAAEEIVRQLRLRDLGGIIVIDFIDMVLESNRDLVMRRLVECLGRDRTKHQVAEVTSLGLVQMTRKRVGQGLLEAFSEPCEHCGGRGVKVHLEPVVERPSTGGGNGSTPAVVRRPDRPSGPPEGLIAVASATLAAAAPSRTADNGHAAELPAPPPASEPLGGDSASEPAAAEVPHPDPVALEDPVEPSIALSTPAPRRRGRRSASRPATSIGGS